VIDTCRASTAQWRAICTTDKFQNSVTCHILSASMYSCVSGVLSAPLASFRIQWRAIFFQPVCIRVSVGCYLHHWQVSEFSDVPYSFSRYVFVCQWCAICTTDKLQNSVTCHTLSPGMCSCISGVLSVPLASFRIQWPVIFFKPVCSCVSGVLSTPLISFRIQWRAILFHLVCVHVSVACCCYHLQVSEFSDVPHSFSR